MADLIVANRTSVLEGARAGSANVSIKVAAPAYRLSLRAKADAVTELSQALDISLPQTPKTSTTSALRAALWLGPDEWLVIDQGESNLMEACASVTSAHSATDVSHRNVAMTVSGEGAEATLNAGCPQDLSLEGFPVGACSRTLFGKAEVVLLRVTEDTFRVECWRSFADYVFDLLEEGARDA
ncbi:MULTISPECIES: sarcosine oxidase subunit gamma [unclassified Rhizobium]|uniref:sarcosine oxidase subunit gamma n=1 Tax=unclassified Rhizobium TaxID=2613769 RepID=UPI00177AB66F|nr:MULTISPECIES: sarcosine oxidase subunit gamma [unclassified Rhizobium]MBD8686439.1 sarcosine oxidase subunit gamma [Rhizobium sp. CFBP 13644]MBD8693696.1 sarcosine oxidase subunit gamma [Rhizobium sp. CFBP 13717]